VFTLILKFDFKNEILFLTIWDFTFTVLIVLFSVVYILTKKRPLKVRDDLVEVNEEIAEVAERRDPSQ